MASNLLTIPTYMRLPDAAIYVCVSLFHSSKLIFNENFPDDLAELPCDACFPTLCN